MAIAITCLSILLLASVMKIVLLKRSSAALSKKNYTTLHGGVDFTNDMLEKISQTGEHDLLLEWISKFYLDKLKVNAVLLFHYDKSQESSNARFLSLATKGNDGRIEGAIKKGDSLNVDAELTRDFYWSKRPHLLTEKDMSSFLTPQLQEQTSTAVVTSFRYFEEDYLFLLLKSGEKNDFTQSEIEELYLYQTIADLVMQAQLNSAKMAEVDDRINDAHAEGMLQISTGIIHNIGNALTVLQLKVDEISSDALKADNELIELLDLQILADMKTRLDDGSLAEFLGSDDIGQTYIPSLSEALQVFASHHSDHYKQISELQDIFKKVSEIITLQQQFIGELGTENIESISAILEDSVTMCQTAMDECNITMKKTIDSHAEILVDPALMRQVFFINIKYGIYSNVASGAPDSTIELNCKTEDIDNVPSVVVDIIDSGSYRIVDLDSDMEEKNKTIQQKKRDLQFSKNRVEKYGGTYKIETALKGHGHVRITLPIYVGTESEE
ncbi:MAG: HAMP domain-containing histidine kinase [Lentisphaeria bacterium]|nr:hypothetical protein [Lentisphaeria bacterium]NQZ69634.1 HAMP domain-containing histidine kinase [Lentisphaeria bacterium]